MHPFSKFIQILGKGRNGMRALNFDEAFEAMQMIARYEVEPEQLGAFLMLMRVKEETAEEVAGFTQALRESLPPARNNTVPAIDWPAYAGKKRHLPWFLLAALVLARKGHPVLMHGLSRNDERVYIPEALDVLGVKPADTLNGAQHALGTEGFAYLPIENLSSLTSDLINTRELFGLRPPLHTVARMLNPLMAPLTVIGVFHPNYAEIHQQAAKMLKQTNALVCKGEGGEFERIADRSANLAVVRKDLVWTEQWEPVIPTGSTTKPATLDLNDFRAVWFGEKTDCYGEAAIMGTLAMIIKGLGLQQDHIAAQQLARQWWKTRHNAIPVLREVSL